MTSTSNILSMLGNLDNEEESEEEQCARILHKLEQQCPKERAKRLSLEFAVEKCNCCVRDINYLFALNQAHNKSVTNFRNVVDENIKMQEMLVGRMKSHDWEQVNGLWRFKLKTLQEKKENMLEHFQKQQDLWEQKMRSIPELNYIQKTQKVFEEKEEELLALQQEWKSRKDPLVNKHQRMNKNVQEISTALMSSENAVANLKQEAEHLEAEVKRLNASKFKEMALIKDLEEQLKKVEHKQIKIEKRENFKHYTRTRQASYCDVFNVSSFSVLKVQKVTTLQKCIHPKDVKTLIEGRESYAPLITKIPAVLESFPKEFNENSQPNKIENIKLKPEKQIKILEHIVLKPAVTVTANNTENEQKQSSLEERTIFKTPIIPNIAQQEISSADVEDLKQCNEKGDEKKLFDQNIIKQNVPYKAQMAENTHIFSKPEPNAKDEHKMYQAKKIEYIKVFEKQIPENTLKQEELKIVEKEEKELPKIVIENKELTELENTFVKETKPECVPSSENEEKKHPRVTFSKQELKIGKLETNENRKCDPHEFFVNKTGNNVKKRKSDKPNSDDENLNAKYFKVKVGDYDIKTELDSRPVKPDEVTLGNISGSETEMEKMLREAFELCGGSESTEKKQDTGANSNDDFESFCTQLKKSDLFSKNSEKPSDQNNDNVSGWTAFGNNVKFDDNNHGEKDFFM